MKLTSTQFDLLQDKFLPLGKIPRFENGEIKLSNTSTRRFVFDGFSLPRTGKDSSLVDPNKFDPSYLAFPICETLSTILQDDINLYQSFLTFLEDADRFASTKIESCMQSMAVFSHQSFGDRLFPHIHQDHLPRLPTLSLFFNLTKHGKVAPVLSLFDTVDVDSKAFNRGYTDHKLLLLHERKSESSDIIIADNSAILFDAWNIPHSLSYTDDLWLTIAYDHVKVKNTDGVLVV